MPTLHFLSYHLPSALTRASHLLRRHFRDVTPPRHGNNVVADRLDDLWSRMTVALAAILATQFWTQIIYIYI